MTDRSDEELIAQVMSGEPGALGPLVERHHAPLFGYLYRLTHGQRQLAEDLVQDTFMRVLQQNTFQPGRPFRPWLYATATHLAYDHFRQAAARPTASLNGFAAANLGDAGPGPEDHAQDAVVGQIVAAAIDQLPPEYRAAIILRFYQGFQLQEIAETLQVPLGTVKSRLSVGARRLRDLLVGLREGQPE
jgi:RNA polymerase sigma-70 factor (ECF subfamily)